MAATFLERTSYIATNTGGPQLCAIAVDRIRQVAQQPRRWG
jgi:hypothetical protein